MKTRTAVLRLSPILVAPILVALIALGPTAAFAQGVQGHRGGAPRMGVGPGMSGGQGMAGHHGLSRGNQWHGHRFVPRHSHRPLVAYRYPGVAYRYPGVVYAAPYFDGSGYVYGSGYAAASYLARPPALYAPPPVVYSPTPAYPPVATATIALAPSRPSVIEYPNGRYELRGDGVSMPYTWVWIPNPPPPPAEAPAPPSPPASAPPAPGQAPPPRSQLYRWIDAQGVVHLTDNPETVPESYRKPAKHAGQGGAS